MLDVHPPEHAAHTWRDFLIHIATIVVGLLIAVGLEQTVEALHHRHQLRELREALQQDNQKALQDDADMVHHASAEVAWLTSRIDDLTLALRSHTHPHFIPHLHVTIRSIPVDPTWKAAKASNLVEIMPPDEVPAFAEVDDLIEHLQLAYQAKDLDARRTGFERRFRTSTASDALDFATAAPADIAQDLQLLSEERDNAREQYAFALYLRGCLTAMLRGERNLDRLDDEENRAVAAFKNEIRTDDEEFKDESKIPTPSH